MITKYFRCIFHFKDKFGNMGSITVKVKNKDSEEAIVLFENTYPEITWRTFRFI